MRLVVIAFTLLTTLAGCGSSFRNEQEELTYLSGLSNPTPEQRQRREDLQHKEVEEGERLSGQVSGTLARAKKRLADKTSQEELQWSMKQAKEYEARGDLKLSLNSYRFVLKTYPNSPEAQTAAQEIQRIEAQRAAGSDSKHAEK
jgi:hypothetical protein